MPTVAAWITYGCSLDHPWLQPGLYIGADAAHLGEDGDERGDERQHVDERGEPLVGGRGDRVVGQVKLVDDAHLDDEPEPQGEEYAQHRAGLHRYVYM